MPLNAKRGSKAPETLVQQHCFLESVNPGPQTFQFEAPCATITITNIFTPLSGTVVYNINGTTGNILPGKSYTYTGAAVTSLTLNTLSKIATVHVTGTEISPLALLSYYELLVNGSFDQGPSGWVLIEGVWSGGRINHNPTAAFRAAGYQLIIVAANTTYTLSHDGTGYTAIYDGPATTSLLDYGTGTRTFNTGNNTTIRVYMGNGALPAGSYWYDSVSLKRFV